MVETTTSLGEKMILENPMFWIACVYFALTIFYAVVGFILEEVNPWNDVMFKGMKTIFIVQGIIFASAFLLEVIL